jgi:hypothetical protein
VLQNEACNGFRLEARKPRAGDYPQCHEERIGSKVNRTAFLVKSPRSAFGYRVLRPTEAPTLQDVLSRICTIVVQLVGSRELTIRTTTSHALQVLRGHTIFPPKKVTVVDLDGKTLTIEDLERREA